VENFLPSGSEMDYPSIKGFEEHKLFSSLIKGSAILILEPATLPALQIHIHAARSQH
jgi:hypothetical protein